MDSYVSTNHYALCTEDDEEETEDDWYGNDKTNNS
jgi:hypothetical protein